MIIPRKLVLVLGLGLLAGPLGAVEIFLRAGAWWVDYDAHGFPAQVAPALEVGAALGTTRRHVVSFEAARAPWEFDGRGPGPAPSAQLGPTGDGRLTPLLGSYRYYFRDASARWRPFLGASAGVTKVSGRIETFLSGLAWGGDVERWTDTFAGTAGVSVDLTPRVSLELGYRYLHLENFQYRTDMFRGILGFTGGPGPTESFAARNHALSLTLGFRF
jgi:hypothetical protein